VALPIPFRLPQDCLTRLAGWLADPGPLVHQAREVLAPMYQRLQEAIVKPRWQEDFSEEYFVWNFPPDPDLPPSRLLQERPAWLAGLLRLDAEPLSQEEIRHALDRVLSYSPSDLFLPDWGCAILVDQDCGETLQTIEFTNLQLLEYRYIDDRLDDSMRAAYQSIHQPPTSWLPFRGSHTRALRMVGELQMEATQWFERTGNVLKLFGDQYLARVHQHLVERFHLQQWEDNIQRKLEVLEDIYQVLTDQAATLRSEFLEIIVVVLILIEILLAVFRVHS
jgi:hypothetical protein